jgi:hypothetical protein
MGIGLGNEESEAELGPEKGIFPVWHRLKIHGGINILIKSSGKQRYIIIESNLSLIKNQFRQ